MEAPAAGAAVHHDCNNTGHSNTTGKTVQPLSSRMFLRSLDSSSGKIHEPGCRYWDERKPFTGGIEHNR